MRSRRYNLTGWQSWPEVPAPRNFCTARQKLARGDVGDLAVGMCELSQIKAGTFEYLAWLKVKFTQRLRYTCQGANTDNSTCPDAPV